MSLLGTANALWREALACSESNEKMQLERALKCLYAGLELVLPTAMETKFRLLLAYILQKHTSSNIEACESIRKSLQLIHSVFSLYERSWCLLILVEGRLSIAPEIFGYCNVV